jgi:pimeloyl-ACP methyl ester carboxylesterase
MLDAKMASMKMSTCGRGCTGRGRRTPAPATCPRTHIVLNFVPTRVWQADPRRQGPPSATPGADTVAVDLEKTTDGFPSFIPKEYLEEIEEPACLKVLQSMQMARLMVPSLGLVKTAYVHTPYSGPKVGDASPPAFVLLHGFDSSMLEFRRFIPKLAESVGDVYAVDLAGWGFSDCGFGERSDIALGPEQKRDHLQKFIEDVVGRPVTLLGTSLGGSVAIDFASEYQNEWVDRLVLVDAQGFIDGIGPMSSMPRFLSVLGVKVLKSVGLRQMAHKMAYFDKDRYATDDAMRIGRLHTHLDGWVDANVAFMSSGGYAVSKKLEKITLPCLVAWGRNDEILDPSYADKFMEVLPDARLVWIEECGHVPALEQPDALVAAIKDFM